MKYDIKNILLGILILLSAFLFYKWYFSTNSVDKAENNRLKIENKQLEKERNDISKTNDSLVIHYINVEKQVLKTQEMIRTLNRKFDKLELDVRKANADLEESQNEINDVIERIKYLREHPIKRTGNELIESLGDKNK